MALKTMGAQETSAPPVFGKEKYEKSFVTSTGIFAGNLTVLFDGMQSQR